MTESKRNLQSFFITYIIATVFLFHRVGFMDLNPEISSEDQKKWTEIMLQHSFEESDWFNARKSLLDLLESNNRMASEDALLSYISCCAEAAGCAYPTPLLTDSVNDFYQQYGMDQSEPKKFIS